MMKINNETNHSFSLIIGVGDGACRALNHIYLCNNSDGIDSMYKSSDMVLMFSIDRIASSHCNASISEVFKFSDLIFNMPVDIIIRMLSSKEYPLIDFDDLKTVIQGANGLAVVISGIGDGEDRITEALHKLYGSPYLLDVEIKVVNNILLFIESGSENQIRMSDIGIIIDNLQEKFGENAVIVWGCGINTNLRTEISLSAVLVGELLENSSRINNAKVS